MNFLDAGFRRCDESFISSLLNVALSGSDWVRWVEVVDERSLVHAHNETGGRLEWCIEQMPPPDADNCPVNFKEWCGIS